MKKMLFVCAFCAMCASVFAKTQFPGWKCTDLEKIEAARQSYISEKNITSMLTMDILATLAKKAPESFADIEAAVDSVKKPEKWNEERFNNWRISNKKGFALNRREFIPEAWEFCKKNPTSYDFYYVAYRAKELNFTDEFVYHFMIDFINKYQNHPAVSKALKVALDKSPNIDEATVKADLKKLNRIFSRKLLEDKERWEPFVAEIRTVLETY